MTEKDKLETMKRVHATMIKAGQLVEAAHLKRMIDKVEK